MKIGIAMLCIAASVAYCAATFFVAKQVPSVFAGAPFAFGVWLLDSPDVEAFAQKAIDKVKAVHSK